MRSALLALLLLPALALGGGGVFRRGVPETAKKQPLLGVLVNPASPAQQGAGVLAGARGETVTVTRASSRSCTKGDGTLATLSANTACVEAAGLSTEPAHTNIVPNSTAMVGSGWFAAGDTTNPTGAANVTTAPDGTLTASRITFGSPYIGSGYNQYLAEIPVSAGTYTFSVWLKAETLALVPIELFVHGGASGDGSTMCALSSSSWVRCSTTTTSSGTGYVYVILGASGVNISNTFAAGSIFAWGAQVETGLYAHSYGAVASTPVTTAGDVVQLSSAKLPTTSGSFQVTLTPSWSSGASGVKTLVDARSGTVSGLFLYVSGDALTLNTLAASASTTLSSSALSWTAGHAYRVRATWGAGKLYLYRDGTLVASNVTGTAVVPNAYGTLNVGVDKAAGNSLDGHLSGLRFDR